MPKILLTQQFSDNPPVVESKTKTDFFDTRLTGFFLEVRATGKATYYQRYRDKYRRNRQVRIGPADAMTLEEAREAARQVRSGITNGYDPSEQARKRKEVPLFSEFVENRYLPHITFLILTGARKSEATHARWENVNLETGVWTVPMSKSGKPRYMPLSKAAIALLKNRRINGSEYVFPSPSTGKPMIHTYPAWDKIRRQAGIPDVRIHDLRHNFASLLVNNGRSLYEVQKLLGHADRPQNQPTVYKEDNANGCNPAGSRPSSRASMRLS
jgi:integrase